MIVSSNENDISIWDVISDLNRFDVKINSGTRKRLESYVTLIKSFAAQTESKNAYDLADHITKTSGLFNLLKSDTSPEGISRFETPEK